MKTLLLAVAAAALVSAQPKETPPPGGAPKPFNVPARETYTLANGMRVSLIPYGTVPLVSVRAVVASGNANETAEQVWLADFMAALMKEGTASKTGAQLAQAAARMGGALTVNAGLDTTVVDIGVLGDFAPDAVKLIAEVLRQPSFPASDVERIRANLLRTLSVQLSRPQGKADEAFAKAVYGDHPYGRYFPTPAQLKSYTLEDVRKFYNANYGARRTHLYVAGRFDPSLRKTIATAFEGWAEGPAIVRDPPKLEAKKYFALIDLPGAAQSVLRIGLAVPAQPTKPDYLPFQVTDAILGGSFGSRITSNIRENKGYSYSPFSFLETRYGTAVWQEQADVTTSVTAASIKEILSEVERMRKEPPPETELSAIKNYLGGTFVLRNSSITGLIGQFSFIDLHGLPDEYLRTYVQRINGITRGDVQRIGEQYLDPARMTIVVVGDKAKIEESLSPYR